MNTVAAVGSGSGSRSSSKSVGGGVASILVVVWCCGDGDVGSGKVVG